MEIYSINIDKKKYKQYRTYEEAIEDMNLLVKLNSNSNIEIILEEFCEYGYLDTCCKTYILREYKNSLLKKYF